MYFAFVTIAAQKQTKKQQRALLDFIPISRKTTRIGHILQNVAPIFPQERKMRTAAYSLCC